MVTAIANRRGASLVEVLIALMIMVLGFVSLHRLQVATIRNNKHAAELSHAVQFAGEELERSLGGPFAAITSGSSNRGAFAVTRTVANDTPVPGCKTIRVEAAWTEQGKPRKVTLSAVAASP